MARSDWVHADFNGLLEHDLLCLAHADSVRDETGQTIELRAGMALTAFDEDADDEGKRNDIFASGVVEPSPEWAHCQGSRWALRIDGDGIRHESDLRDRGAQR